MSMAYHGASVSRRTRILMAKTTKVDNAAPHTRYEYRVWGTRRKTRRALARMADEQTRETVEDCYFIVDDQSFNAKVRDNKLKIKQLVAEKRGFEQWTSDWHRAAKTAPPPFDLLFEQLRLDREQKGKSFSLKKAVDRLDPDAAARAIFVSKARTRYRIDSIRAEITDITIQSTGEKLNCLAIEGDDLDELTALRKELKLHDEENVAVHVAIDALD